MTTIENKPMAWGALAGLLVFLLGLLAWDTGCQRGVVETPKAPDPIAELAPETVMISSFCDGVNKGYASGLAIDDKHVLTVGHVMMCDKGTPTAIVTFTDGKRYPMHPVNAMLGPILDGDIDGWVKLEVDEGTFSETIAAPIYAFPKAGETVCQETGMPKRGKVCGVVTRADSTPTFAFTVPVVPGNSGSPVYDSNAKLVGFTLYCSATEKGGECRPIGGGAAVSLIGMML